MKIAIIGSGIAGLSAARELRQNGVDVYLYEKSRGVGGRMSTRYAGDWEFDHGAQYFTAQDEDFKKTIDLAMQAGVIVAWPAKGLYLTEQEVSLDIGRARYVGYPRMNSLPKYWVDGLDIEFNHCVRRVERTDKWTLSFEDGSQATGFDGVISTLPPEQARVILPSDYPVGNDVSKAQMQPCFALMVGLPDPLYLEWDTLRIKDLPIDWISINSAKPGRSSAKGALVIHSEANWSAEHVNADRDWIENVLVKTASAFLDLPLEEAPHKALHRWLFASRKTSSDIDCLKREGFVFAGDWCRGGRVQGAWLSGRAAARAFL